VKKIIFLIIIPAAMFFISCGDPVVDISAVIYQPKIVVQGYVYPDEDIKQIRISRNFPLDKAINPGEIVLTPGGNAVIAQVNGVNLNYDPVTQTYFMHNIVIQKGETYTLDITALIDGEQLQTTSITTVPLEGFSLLDTDLGTITYRDPVIFRFTPSPGTDFYVFSIIPESASIENFIYDNPFLPNLEISDVEENLDDFRFQFDVVINANSAPGTIHTYEVHGLDTWFYSSYKVIVYAGDKNFKDYVLTASNVQQFDGNFIDPRMYLTGDGIGIFGSAIRDTVIFNLVPSAD
jgi:hypothetical protein